MTALALALLVTPWLAAAALAVEPSPVLIDPLDPRADGEGPGLVGSPILAALAVVAIGLLAAAVTALYVRFLARR